MANRDTKLWFWLVIALFLLVPAGIIWVAFSLLKGAIPFEDAPKFVESVAAIGVLTMALLQVLKRLVPLRGWFQEHMLQNWFGSRATDKLARLAVTRDHHRLFELPVEQLCAQILAGAEALFDPSAPNEPTDSRESKDHEAAIRALAGRDGHKIAESFINLNRMPSQQEGNEEYLTLRSQLMHRFQRNIDGLQIEIGIAWRRRLWIYALLMSTLLAAAASADIPLPYADPASGWHKRIFFIVIGGIVGGFMATVARDVVAVIERWRR